MLDPHGKNKVLLKDIKDMNKWGDSPCLRQED